MMDLHIQEYPQRISIQSICEPLIRNGEESETVVRHRLVICGLILGARSSRVPLGICDS